METLLVRSHSKRVKISPPTGYSEWCTPAGQRLRLDAVCVRAEIVTPTRQFLNFHGSSRRAYNPTATFRGAIRNSTLVKYNVKPFCDNVKQQLSV